MHNFFSVFNFALAGIFQLEQAIPQAGMGMTKRQIILTAVDLAAKAAEGAGAVNQWVGLVGKFVDTAVTLLNEGGVFVKPAPVPAA